MGKKILVPQQSNGNYKFIGGVIFAIVTIYFLFNGYVDLLNESGEYSSYFGESFYDEDVAEYEYPDRVKHHVYNGPKEKACLVMMVQNPDLYDVVRTVKVMEDRFNLHYNYDWVFINNKPLSDEFKYVLGEIVSGKAKFATVPEGQFAEPESVDKAKALKVREQMMEINIPTSGLANYRNLWRYKSGFLYNHRIFDDYDYFWITEVDMKIACDVNYDVFKFMRENNKRLGFVKSYKTSIFPQTVKTIWKHTKDFMSFAPNFVSENNLLKFVSEDGNSYNQCGIETGNMVGAFEFFRSKEYQAYFQFVDEHNGWYYERWTDDDFVSIAASMLLDKDEFHFFDDFGYNHQLDEHAFEFVCPQERGIRLENKCSCNPYFSLTWKSQSCVPRFYEVSGKKKPSAWDSY
ncbi:hypothetical protein Kpol_1029p12 [Vanderwaltozyma polyspora DSM 70294]|uniref:Uncharacterized protein n=1 Tax=Vanderwaltozyma polyspora (strain ATCC 22028 / DSM 70294 / BCRC 21397 / CBS 2163 / NBRC 10782 / NRRL Y-8283 / UCD 57-17) TaxID=436907 RepID=A7TR70_VANPO|nr:uncharacterized protein Kpol_1029p12 [Vanderwaltozyma polyspora DSM 70294]EDO15238.1 hypothetical protein Kpol_1029p12 [Vanderwaltozyma polyspora DSM 70294]